MSDSFFSRDKFHILDGAMGTVLQTDALSLGDIPETLSITNPRIIENVHRTYIEAGSEIIYTNTFGANTLKLKNSGYNTFDIVEKSLRIAKLAANGKALVALDIGPLGELMMPHGTLSFDDAYNLFKEIIVAGKDADIIVFETFSDLYELKSAILCAKENSALPIFCSMSFEADGRTFTGCTVESFAQTATGLGVDAVGINCSLGPKEILPLAKRLCDSTSENFSVFIKPNAGLPSPDGSGYSLNTDEFCALIDLYSDIGINIFGGCCGTTPEHIRKISQLLKSKIPLPKSSQNASYICSATHAEKITSVTVVGERINPTGKKRFREALIQKDLDYILTQAIEQADAGAAILDVNVGIPEINETEMLNLVMQSIQSVIDLPLQLDCASPQALSVALRYYNGKPIVNSVNGEEESLLTILPLCKKYGAAVIGLTLDSKGIPDTVLGRFAIAERIVNRAISLGISKNDIYIDCLTMTIGSDQRNAQITLEAVQMVKDKLHVRTALGVSNISFGLPVRNNINSTFLTLSMQKGLDLAIINPNSEEMMSAIFSYRALYGIDKNCIEYIMRYKNSIEANRMAAPLFPQDKISLNNSLTDYIVQGIRGKAKECARELITTLKPLEIVDRYIIPALDKVGIDYESGKAFLPELLQSAAAAQSAFEVIKEYFTRIGQKSDEKGKVILATVKGDVHDIGKNIVKVVLENYGYTIIDLGRDVSSEAIVKAINENDVKLIGLSALMTTTVKSMQQTISLIKQTSPHCKIMIGGAVLTAEYAKTLNADYYAKDAKQAVDIAKKIFKKESCD